jgi:hypothetical protein
MATRGDAWISRLIVDARPGIWRLVGLAVEAVPAAGSRPTIGRTEGAGAMDDNSDNEGPGERVVYRARVHWSVYLPGAFLVLWGGVPDDSRLAGWFVIFGVILLIYALFLRRTTGLTVTDRRVIARTSRVFGAVSEMDRSEVEGVEIRRNVLGRLLGFGTVVVRGTGRALGPVKTIADAAAVRDHLAANSLHESPVDMG